MYRLIITPRAERDIGRLPPEYRRLAIRRLRTLSENPRPRGTKRLQGRARYRLRVGVYRVLYGIDDGVRAVTVHSVRHRREVYR